MNNRSHRLNKRSFAVSKSIIYDQDPKKRSYSINHLHELLFKFNLFAPSPRKAVALIKAPRETTNDGNS